MMNFIKMDVATARLLTHLVVFIFKIMEIYMQQVRFNQVSFMGGVQTTRFINQNNLLQFSIIG
jgi:hypothetical protein